MKLERKNKMNNKRSGQALIESIAAIGIIVTGVLGTLAFLSTSIGLNRIVTAQYAGTYRAAAYIESYKNCLDTEGWDSRAVCLDVTMMDLGEQITLNGTSFRLEYDDTSCASDVVTDNDRVFICATASWREKGRSFSVNLEDHFYNWRQ